MGADSLNSFLRFTGLGVQFVTIFVLFVLGGMALDAKVDAEVPWFVILGALFGGILATFTLVRQVFPKRDTPKSSRAAHRTGTTPDTHPQHGNSKHDSRRDADRDDERTAR